MKLLIAGETDEIGMRGESGAETWFEIGGAWIARARGSLSTEPMRELLTTAGVHVLHNESAVENGLTLVGLADYWSGEFDPERAFHNVGPSSPTVVLCHNLDGKKHLQNHSWNLMYSWQAATIGKAGIPTDCGAGALACEPL